MLTVQAFVNNPVTSNCYILFDKEKGKECIIVDPGSKFEEELIAFLSQEDLQPAYIILTHEHFDHCWGVNQLVERYRIPILCSVFCADAIKYEKRNCSVFYDNTEAFVINKETVSVESIGMKLPFYGDDIQFYKTPGHTEAGISFLIGSYLITGDTLIKNEKTVTKLPTGSRERLGLSKGFYEKMKGRGVKVCAGHGAMFELDEYDLQKMIASSC